MVGYDYEVVYRKGSGNAAADALSREPSLKEGHLVRLTGSFVTSSLLTKVQEAYQEGSKINELISKV